MCYKDKAFTEGPDDLILSHLFGINTVLGISLLTAPAKMQWALLVAHRELASDLPVKGGDTVCLAFCSCLR